MIKTGLQFKVSVAELDAQLAHLRKGVKLANAIRAYEGTDIYVSKPYYNGVIDKGKRKLRVDVYYRLGTDNPHAPKYRNCWRPFRIKKEHAQYAAVYVRDCIVWG
jgi:hypothetical protein